MKNLLASLMLKIATDRHSRPGPWWPRPWALRSTRSIPPRLSVTSLESWAGLNFRNKPWHCYLPWSCFESALTRCSCRPRQEQGRFTTMLWCHFLESCFGWSEHSVKTALRIKRLAEADLLRTNLECRSVATFSVILPSAIHMLS